MATAKGVGTCGGLSLSFRRRTPPSPGAPPPPPQALRSRRRAGWVAEACRGLGLGLGFGVWGLGFEVCGVGFCLEGFEGLRLGVWTLKHSEFGV